MTPILTIVGLAVVFFVLNEGGKTHEINQKKLADEIWANTQRNMAAFRKGLSDGQTN